jgi:hypothetical protein
MVMPCKKKFKPKFPRFEKPTAGRLAGVAHELDEMTEQKFGKPNIRKVMRRRIPTRVF